jgi:hypothetical protein
MAGLLLVKAGMAKFRQTAKGYKGEARRAVETNCGVNRAFAVGINCESEVKGAAEASCEGYKKFAAGKVCEGKRKGAVESNFERPTCS